jgi:DNA-binding transcriptional ArsR family regulator
MEPPDGLFIWRPAYVKVNTGVQRRLAVSHSFLEGMTLDDTVLDRSDMSWISVLIDPVRLAVLRALCELPTATIAELRLHCHSSDPTVRRHLDALAALGLVHEQPGKRDGLTPGRPASRFTLAGETADRLSALFAILEEPLAPNLPPDRPPPALR